MIMFSLLTWVVVIWVCSLCDNSSSCTLVICALFCKCIYLNKIPYTNVYIWRVLTSPPPQSEYLISPGSIYSASPTALSSCPKDFYSPTSILRDCFQGLPPIRYSPFRLFFFFHGLSSVDWAPIFSSRSWSFLNISKTVQKNVSFIFSSQYYL